MRNIGKLIGKAYAKSKVDYQYRIYKDNTLKKSNVLDKIIKQRSGNAFAYYDGGTKLADGSSETSQTKYIQEFNRWISRTYTLCRLPAPLERENRPAPVNIYDGNGVFVKTVIDWRREHGQATPQLS